MRSRLLIALVIGAPLVCFSFTSCVYYQYAYQLSPNPSQGVLSIEDTAAACQVVDRLAKEEGMQASRPEDSSVVREYYKHEVTLLAGETTTFLWLKRVGNAIEVEVYSANRGDWTQVRLEKEVAARFRERFGSRVLKKAYPQRLGLYG